MLKILSLCCSTTCSFRCGYCAAHMGNDRVQTRRVCLNEIGPDRYLALIEPILDRHKPMVVNFCGPGEPTESEHFSAMASAVLAKGHRLLVYTNMSRADRLFSVITPSNAECITVGASYHVTTFIDQQNSGLRARIYTALTRLVATGCTVKLMVPMAPPVLDDPSFETEVAALAEAAVGPFHGALIDLGHTYRNRRYPLSYTQPELARLAELVARFGAWRPLPRDIQNLKHMTPRLELAGKLCLSPAQELSIGLAGTLWHCSPSGPLQKGTLLGYDVEKLYEPSAIPCPFRICHCKTTGIESCLVPAGISLEKHYAEIYRRRGQLDIAQQLLLHRELVEHHPGDDPNRSDTEPDNQ